VTQQTGLTVRQFEREHVRLPIELVIAEQHVGQVRFSQSSSAAGRNMIRGLAVDISPGGMGLQCAQFLPRMCEGVVRVFEPAAGGDSAANDPAPTTVLLEHRVKVRRVFLLDREPTYAIGLAFVDLKPGIEKTVASVLDRFGSADPGPMPIKGGPVAGRSGTVGGGGGGGHA
jgi:hypothetical protein